MCRTRFRLKPPSSVLKLSKREWFRFSVTRLGKLLDFGKLFKACRNNCFAQIAHILGNFCKCVKMFNFSSEIILGSFYRHLAIFTGHTVRIQKKKQATYRSFVRWQLVTRRDSEPCSVAGLFFIISLFWNINENLPISYAKVGSEFCQILNKPSKYCHLGTLNICQSEKISPNLVSLKPCYKKASGS